MLLENLKVGKGIEVYVTRDGYRYRLNSNIEGTDKGKIYISLITSGSRSFRFLDTDFIEMIYRDGTFIWQWEKLKGTIEDFEGEKVHVLRTNENGKTFNRRNSYRVIIGEEILIYRFYDKPEFKDKEKAPNEIVYLDDYGNEIGAVNIEKFEGKINDLSESGAGITTNKELEIGDIIGFSLNTSFGTMYFKGSIVRHMDIRNGKYMGFYGCTFLRSDKNLTKYLFGLQREQLHKQKYGG